MSHMLRPWSGRWRWSRARSRRTRRRAGWPESGSMLPWSWTGLVMILINIENVCQVLNHFPPKVFQALPSCVPCDHSDIFHPDIFLIPSPWHFSDIFTLMCSGSDIFHPDIFLVSSPQCIKALLGYLPCLHPNIVPNVVPYTFLNIFPFSGSAWLYSLPSP